MEGKSERRTRKIKGVMKNGDQSETVTGLIFVQKMIGEKWVCILSGLRL